MSAELVELAARNANALEQGLLDAIRNRMVHDLISQTEMADRTGLSQARVSDILRGRYAPRLVTLCLMAAALHLEVRAELVAT